MLKNLKPVNPDNAGWYLAFLWLGMFAGMVAGFLIGLRLDVGLMGPLHVAILLILFLFSGITYLFLYIDAIASYKYWLLLVVPTLVIPTLFATLLALIPLAHLTRLTAEFWRTRLGFRDKAV